MHLSSHFCCHNYEVLAVKNVEKNALKTGESIEIKRNESPFKVALFSNL